MEKLGSFSGGLKLAGHKKRSTQTAIRKIPLSKTLVLPLQQHIGEASDPIVSVGDKVLKGQKIARADGHVSVYLHAPSSGTITAIDQQPIPHPSGLSALCITLETDGEDRWLERPTIADFTTLSSHEIRQSIRQAGIVGLGGAGFPSFIKLNPGIHHTVETLIINGVECEPYITCDDMLMRERADGILDGVEIIRYALRVKNCVIAIEDNKPEAIAAMKLALAARPSIVDTEVVAVPTRYPAGSEKQLIQVVTGKQVPSHGLPIDLGIVCHNIGTTYAIARAIKHGEPLISRIVTVTGKYVTNPGNFEVLFGTPMHELLAYCDTQRQPNEPFILGGPMMGYNLSNDQLPVTKTANCILVGVEDSAPAAEPMPCIRCGECATVCPVNLLPQQLYWHARAKDLEKTREYNLFDCIECGCCSYVCPSKIPLVHYYRFAKTEIMTAEQEAKKADAARIRHDNRQERQDLEKKEKEERQRQRKLALAASKAAKEKKAAEEAKKAAEQGPVEADSKPEQDGQDSDKTDKAELLRQRKLEFAAARAEKEKKTAGDAPAEASSKAEQGGQDAAKEDKAELLRKRKLEFAAARAAKENKATEDAPAEAGSKAKQDDQDADKKEKAEKLRLRKLEFAAARAAKENKAVEEKPAKADSTAEATTTDKKEP